MTLGDEEARKRSGQKTVLERAGPATFDACECLYLAASEKMIVGRIEDTEWLSTWRHSRAAMVQKSKFGGKSKAHRGPLCSVWKIMHCL